MKTSTFFAICKRYSMALTLLAVNIILCFALPEIGFTAADMSLSNFKEMLSVLPPIFILLGLLDVWVDKETMMKFLGKGSGIRGGSMAFLLGACAAGPLYAAFPVATVMLRKNASLFNVFVFIGAWSTAKVPMLTFEAANLGLTFMVTRLCINLVGIWIIAGVVNASLTNEQQQEVYQIAEQG
ncbi:permease [Bengtsoniella intestinalis]|uniref:permease n=1 Tax=Bengtsoniella intestinalis TaxID=3073143 RepID=UPI00391F53B5